MDPTSTNGNHPPVNGNGAWAGGGLPRPPSATPPAAAGTDAEPGCWQLPGLLLRLVFWLGMLVLIVWLVVVVLTSTS